MRRALTVALIALCAVSFGRPSAAAEGEAEKWAKATKAALKWLAENQEADGHWDAKKLGAKMNADAGCTGLALLAFLGSASDADDLKRDGYKDNVARAARWIISKQDETGCIGRGYEWPQSEGVGCAHAICGLALAELHGMSKDKGAFRLPAQKAVDYSLKHQTQYSGWGGAANAEPDLATTTWFVMQLKSAKLARLKVDGASFLGVMAFLDKVTGGNGRASARKEDPQTPAMTAAGMVCRQLLGAPNSDPTLQKAAKSLPANLPDWKEAAEASEAGPADDASYCYWYWGTLSAFQHGGEVWTTWNENSKPLLVEKQNAGGSWEPRSKLDAACGRAFTTALGALSMEIYYRGGYIPLYDVRSNK